ncbi:MerR family transcriptional regulator [Desulfonauticus submarinus]
MKKTRYYKIGEAAKRLGLEPYILRFWEKEFDLLKPVRSSSGQRLYTQEHLRLLERIKFLLYEEKLTIQGAKLRLKEEARWLEVFMEVKKELEEMLLILKD